MPPTKTPLPKKFFAISLLYGLISAILMALLTVVLYFTTASGNTPVIMWNYLLFAICMFMGIKTYQKRVIKTTITFKEAYVSGVFIGLTAAIIFAVFMIFYTKFIDVEFIKNFVRINSLQMEKNLKAEDILQQIKYITPFAIGFYAFGQLMLVSLFLPLLLFVFFKHEKRETSDSEKS